MIAALVALLLAPAAAPPADDVATIRAARLAYNAVIAGRQADRFPDFVAGDVVQLSSNGAIVTGAAPLAASYAGREFQDPAFIAYDRQPDTIEVAPNGRFAVERGHWRGRFRTAGGGETGNRGLYQAGWVRTPAGWRIRTEAYVKLVCATPDCR